MQVVGKSVHIVVDVI